VLQRRCRAVNSALPQRCGWQQRNNVTPQRPAQRLLLPALPIRRSAAWFCWRLRLQRVTCLDSHCGRCISDRRRTFRFRLVPSAPPPPFATRPPALALLATTRFCVERFGDAALAWRPAVARIWANACLCVVWLAPLAVDVTVQAAFVFPCPHPAGGVSRHYPLTTVVFAR